MILSLRSGPLDLDRRQLTRGGDVVVLSSIEVELLRWFLENPERVASRDVLLVEVWGFPRPVRTRAVDNTIMRLRRKIELDPGDPDHLLTLRGVGYTFTPLHTAPQADPGRADLPPQSPDPAFFGRTAELTALATAAASSRWVTVLGPGGVGKTRLVATWARGRGDVTWVDLAAASDDADLRRGLATVLGIQSASPEGLTAHLSTHTGVLVFDNVEQIADPISDRLTAWLAACPGVSAVLTSRERLRVATERVLELTPLDAQSAVSLFQHRAGALGTDSVDGALARAIVDRVDRLPLAIELAAARTRVLPLPRLLQGLDDTLRVLRSDRRDLPTRHRTMDAAVRGSWELLPESERVLLCSASLLVDGFDLDTLEATVDLGQDGPWVLDALSALRDRSLVVALEGFGGDARFRMLEVVRQFADARLAERSDRHTLEDHVVDYLLARSTRWRAGIHEADPQPSIRRLTLEQHNLIALARRVQGRRPGAAARLIHNLGWLLLNRVPAPELLALGVDAADRAGDGKLRVTNRLLHGRALEWTGQRAQAERIHEETLVLARALDPIQVPHACFHLTSHLSRQGHTERAIALCEEGLQAAQDHDRPVIGAMLHQRMGMVLTYAGQHRRARAPLERALEQYRAQDQETAVPFAMLSLAYSDTCHGELDRAHAGLQRVIERADTMGLSRLGSMAHVDGAWVALMRGRFQDAAAQVDPEHPAIAQIQDPPLLARASMLRAVVGLADGGQPDLDALGRLLQVWIDHEEVRWRWFTASLIGWLTDRPVTLPQDDGQEVEVHRAWLAALRAPAPSPPPRSEPSYFHHVWLALWRGRRA